MAESMSTEIKFILVSTLGSSITHHVITRSYLISLQFSFSCYKMGSGCIYYTVWL